VVTQKDIARHLGISRSTVAQALNGIGRVNPETHARVLKAAHELGYRPNPMARALVTGKTHTLAFWYFPLLNEVSMGLINRLQMLVPPYGLVSMNLGLYRSSWEEPHEEFPPGEWPVDGIFAFRTGPLPDHVVHRTVGKPPIVYIGYDNFPPPPDGELDTVQINLRSGAEEAVRYLVQTRKRVAMLCVPGVVNGRYGAALAYESVMQEAGRELEHIYTPLHPPYRLHARHTLAAYVRLHGCPDAIFCPNDEQAIGSHAALAELGRRVPEDVAIVGCDGIEETEHHVPPISTIVQPFDEICTVAWEFLQRRIADPEAPRQVREINARFVPRDSSRPSQAQPPQAALLQKKRRKLER
jgi:LacI family transcriptional regulator